MKKDLTPFEQNLKQTMANYEVPYDVKSWYGIEKRMSYSNASHAPWIVALAATLLVSSAVGLGIYQHRYNPSQAFMANTSTLFDYPNVENIRSSVVWSGSIQEENIEAIAPIARETIQFSETKTKPASMTFNSEPSKAEESGRGEIDESVLAVSTPVKDKTELSNNQLRFVSNVREACVGVEVDFKVTDGPSSGSYLWNFGDGHFSSEVNPRHKFAKSGKYDISLSITSDDGQIRTTVSNEMILINPTPDANFEWRFINDDPRLARVQIVNTSNYANQYVWKFDDESGSDQVSPVMSVVEAGNHVVSLRVSNDHGCTDNVVKQISVNPNNYNIGASTTFRPGKETYMPVGVRNKQTKFELVIYNGQNEKVYETSNYQKGWDGTLPDGNLAKVGDIYMWKVIINNTSKEQKYFNGEFTVFP